ncbi:PREDICTED: huntingtin-interacting protein K isoform X2 [Myotis davidii]|uniref:huntingtin-interacting protein K isoform X2 n=1 Tax=Myotis davidii TaxID=225400 RepID=UPI0003EC1F67|nr:PREDICTED: huntingtin-interacting protein K isoform X2 [Myotis davidii]
MKAWPRHSPPPPLPADVVGIPGSRGAGRSLRRRGVVDMATEGDVELELETETSGPERPPEKPRKHDSGAADLERVTDYAEEKEIQSSNLETGEGTGKSHHQEGRSGADSE